MMKRRGSRAKYYTGSVDPHNDGEQGKEYTDFSEKKV